MNRVSMAPLHNMTISVLAVTVVLVKLAAARRTFPHCNSALGMSDGSIPDHRIHASSTCDPTLYGPQRGRLNVSLDSTGWCSSIAKAEKEYLEVDLGRDMRVSAVATQGVWIKNSTTARYEYTYVSKFFLSYRRSTDEKWRWRRYMENEVSVTLFETSNKTGVQQHHLLTPHIARYVRFVTHEGHGNMWCLKVELFGCPWTDQDGLVSYRISQGNGRSDGPGLGDLRDVGYDGRRLAYGTKRGVLSGGLGQLVDGVLGKNVLWNDTDNPEWVHWMGWRDHTTVNPSVTFKFSTLRRFSLIRFHVLNQAGVEKLLFGKVVVSFSRDGEYYAWKTVYEPSVDKRRLKDRAFFLEVDVQKNTGKYVTCDFYYHGWWVLLSEVQLVSVPFEILISELDEKNTTKTGNTTQTTMIPTDMIWNVKESGGENKGVEGSAILIAAIAGGLAAAALILSGAFLWLRRRKRAQRMGQDEPLNPLRVINPSKKNSLNRRNDNGARAAKIKLAELDKEKKEEEEEVFGKLNNLERSYHDELLKDMEDAAANMRPESREITLEEEKAEVLAEMRKLSDSVW